MAKVKNSKHEKDPQGKDRGCINYLCFYRLVAWIGGLSVLSLILANALSMYDIIDSWDQIELDEALVSLCVCAFNGFIGFLILMGLIERHWILSQFSILTTWPGMGIFMIFLGMNTINSVYGIKASTSSEKTSTDTENLRDAIIILGWVISGIGAWFVVVGLFGGKDMKKEDEKLEG